MYFTSAVEDEISICEEADNIVSVCMVVRQLMIEKNVKTSPACMWESHFLVEDSQTPPDMYKTPQNCSTVPGHMQLAPEP